MGSLCNFLGGSIVRQFMFKNPGHVKRRESLPVGQGLFDLYASNGKFVFLAGSEAISPVVTYSGSSVFTNNISGIPSNFFGKDPDGRSYLDLPSSRFLRIDLRSLPIPSYGNVSIVIEYAPKIGSAGGYLMLHGSGNPSNISTNGILQLHLTFNGAQTTGYIGDYGKVNAITASTTINPGQRHCITMSRGADSYRYFSISKDKVSWSRFGGSPVSPSATILSSGGFLFIGSLSAGAAGKLYSIRIFGGDLGGDTTTLNMFR